MALLDNIKNMLFTPPSPMQTKTAGSMVGYFNVDTAQGKILSYNELASEGYLKNAIVYRCVNIC